MNKLFSGNSLFLPDCVCIASVFSLYARVIAFSVSVDASGVQSDENGPSRI